STVGYTLSPFSMAETEIIRPRPRPPMHTKKSSKRLFYWRWQINEINKTIRFTLPFAPQCY
ncbi:MAG: hypothetical protein KDB79_10805, partial [Acidobacteria bacterium]|nr:hypothetical protein [Acidobacteriota bacterium]